MPVRPLSVAGCPYAVARRTVPGSFEALLRTLPADITWAMPGT
ncbi:MULTISPECIES: hypothetical protein [Streptomyces]|nr:MULTISPECIES: hypothetical protein [Streptomyces]